MNDSRQLDGNAAFFLLFASSHRGLLQPKVARCPLALTPLVCSVSFENVPVLGVIRIEREKDLAPAKRAVGDGSIHGGSHACPAASCTRVGVVELDHSGVILCDGIAMVM
jgi:hypothetical protein